MAAAAACRRVGLLGRNSGIGLHGYGVYGSSQVLSPALDYRQISQLVKSNGKRLFLVDTLALVISVISLCYSISEVSFL